MEGLVVTPSFWQGKRVFITGHTGFKGSWLSLWLQQLGADVTGYALPPPTSPSLFDLAQVNAGMASVIGDVRDGENLAKAMRDAEPEIVFHLAAQSLVRLSYANPIETYSTNVMGVVHMLEAVRQARSVKAVVNVTSDKCYENKEWEWGYRENEAMGGFDPYSNSKGCAELVTSAYRSSFFNPANYSEHGVALASARSGNVIGGGDWAKDRLIPDIVAAFDSNRPLEIRNPSAIRPWQHVLEPLRAYLLLAEKLYTKGCAFAEAWNFGPSSDDTRPVEWIVHQLAKQWPQQTSWQLGTNADVHEASSLKLDISKAGHRLGWRPAMRLEQALVLIAEWAREKNKGSDMRVMTQTQILNYQIHALASTNA